VSFFKKVILLVALAHLLSLEVAFTQPRTATKSRTTTGSPPPPPDIPINGIEFLVGIGGLLGAKHFFSRAKKRGD
jgi:hypothetical protein